MTFLFDPERSDVFWEAGIYNGTGVVRSDDGGDSFVALGDVHHNDTVSVDFTDPERRTLLAGGHEQTQLVYRSIDGGQTWTNVGSALPDGTNHSTGVYVVDSQTHLVGCTGWAGGTSGIFRTENGGQSWEHVSESGGRFSPLAHSDGSLYWANAGSGMVRSTDQGRNWSEALGAGDARDVQPIELPDGRVATLGRDGVIVSEDHGASWRTVTTALPYNPNGLTYSRFQRAFYIFHFSCDPPVPDDAVISYHFDWEVE